MRPRRPRATPRTTPCCACRGKYVLGALHEPEASGEGPPIMPQPFGNYEWEINLAIGMLAVFYCTEVPTIYQRGAGSEWNYCGNEMVLKWGMVQLIVSSTLFGAFAVWWAKGASHAPFIHALTVIPYVALLTCNITLALVGGNPCQQCALMPFAINGTGYAAVVLGWGILASYLKHSEQVYRFGQAKAVMLSGCHIVYTAFNTWHTSVQELESITVLSAVAEGILLFEILHIGLSVRVRERSVGSTSLTLPTAFSVRLCRSTARRLARASCSSAQRQRSGSGLAGSSVTNGRPALMWSSCPPPWTWTFPPIYSS